MRKFAQSLINTKLWRFNFRVYAENQGKETVVLFTENFNPQVPALVRVHSECMTGDVFHSMQCDCGDQLDAAIKAIQENGNWAIIYLRQEGRGIWLYEKIRAYELQAKGYDTFEANIMLGHKPDQRTYEMVKTALHDLGVKDIVLLTNNPSKVSEIAKTGINIIDRKPLFVGHNATNEKYFNTKKTKFKHFFSDEVSYYFYQFHADKVEIVHEIGEFLKDKKTDPLLKICIGVQCDSRELEDKEKMDNILSIFEACELYKGFVPILHFSYKHSKDQIWDTEIIKTKLPFVKYLQINDFTTEKGDLSFIKYAAENFLIDVPLDNSNFSLVEDAAFREIIKKNKSFLLLDNSKWTGVQENKDVLKEKINTLLKYDLNDIAIFGWFGPDDLSNYFELRRYFKINFSIDAETKLKTNGQIDVEKIKTYLTQLIRFDDPAEAAIEQTRTFQNQNRKEDRVNIDVLGNSYSIHPAVFNPAYFPSTTWYAQMVNKYISNDRDFCEVGCGAGIIPCYLAKENNKLKIWATDINPFATENTLYNAKKNGVEDRIQVANGDVLDCVGDMKFDTIFWAMPFWFLDPWVNIDLEDAQFFDPGYRAIRKFLKDCKAHLNKDGQILIGFSTDLGNYDLLKDICDQNHIKLEKIEETEMKEKDIVKFEVFRWVYEK